MHDTNDLRPGTRIDDFTIAYRIARGMNADVFAVWHHGLGTPLVCKRLRAADAANHKWRRLLRAEGAALARLRHPGIVKLIARSERGALPYLLLEHVGTRTLRDELRLRNKLEIGEAIRLVQHVSAAVHYMHECGYLHRDLKPSNIIMREGRPVLLDLGVVWRYGATRRPPDRCGTPQRLAPEQIHREPLLPATDVYTLGTLLFELLTGSRPFHASEHVHDHRAPLDVRYTQLTHTPLAPACLGCHLPPALEAIIFRALAPQVENRFASARELILALDSFTQIKIYPADATTADAAFGIERKMKSAQR